MNGHAVSTRSCERRSAECSSSAGPVSVAGPADHGRGLGRPAVRVDVRRPLQTVCRCPFEELSVWSLRPMHDRVARQPARCSTTWTADRPGALVARHADEAIPSNPRRLRAPAHRRSPDRPAHSPPQEHCACRATAEDRAPRSGAGPNERTARPAPPPSASSRVWHLDPLGDVVGPAPTGLPGHRVGGDVPVGNCCAPFECGRPPMLPAPLVRIDTS